MLFPRHVSRLAASQDFGWIATLRQAGELRIPYAERDTFLHLWWSAPALPMADLPPDLTLPTALGVPTGTLTVFTPDRRTRHRTSVPTSRCTTRTVLDPLDSFQAGIVDLKTQQVIRRDRMRPTAALLTQLVRSGAASQPAGGRERRLLPGTPPVARRSPRHSCTGAGSSWPMGYACAPRAR